MSDRVDAYDYTYPPEAAAQVPSPEREQARLMQVRRFGVEQGREPVSSQGTIPDLLNTLNPGDLLVLNGARVAPARLSAVRAETGGKVSILVLEPKAKTATVLLGTRGRLQPGEGLLVDGDRWTVDQVLGEGRFQVSVASGRPITEVIETVGRMPLPPYIRRDPVADERDDLDRSRYQTLFAHGEGAPRPAVAAPTAGLHLTPRLLGAIRERGVSVVTLRLDVGLGTFRPLRGETLDDHVMHSESYEVSEELAEVYAATRRAGGRVVAVGTTVVRTLESTVSADGSSLTVGQGETRLFLQPGCSFSAVDALFTNFHQPRSTLLVLVSAFAGRDTITQVYRQAIDSGYRLFSYGDAMLLS
ncbi:MAG: S-adenosylmethionine:tRNA ribosyltransferase-isomerase [Pseudohongiellaceae bacterium]|jgi:S-adenosylmethionine:tRNA ribosyltransferase-isomerase